MTGPNDVRVSITLNSTTAMGTLILVVLLLASVNENGSVMAASTGVCIEQGILLIVSLTPMKAQEELKKCCQSRKTVTRNKQTSQLSMQEKTHS